MFGITSKLTLLAIGMTSMTKAQKIILKFLRLNYEKEKYMQNNGKNVVIEMFNSEES